MKRPISTSIRIFALAALAFASLTLAQGKKSAPAEGSKNFLTQTYVDTTVMRALYILNEASAYTGVGGRQSNAVAQSRAVLENLKKQAAGDPNERYALMKIREIEEQIYWEEEEMRKIANDRRILAANQLVSQYNAEVGKMRPDFATLRGLFMRMSEVDQRQANRLADSYNKRYRAISREAQAELEKAINAKNHTLALMELEYCERNRHYLMISSAELVRQRARVEALKGVEVDVPKIVAQIDYGERAFNDRRLSEARAGLMLARDRINEVKRDLAAPKARELSGRVDGLIKKLDAFEDSLVHEAMAVFDRRGAEAAYKYLNDELHGKLGISHERAAVIDQMIISRSPSRGGAQDSKYNVAMVEHSLEQGGGDMFQGIQDKARFRAQERADSLKLEREKAGRIAADIYNMIERKKVKNARKQFDRDKAFLASVMYGEDYDDLELAVLAGRVSKSGAGVAAAGAGGKKASPAKKEPPAKKERKEKVRPEKAAVAKAPPPAAQPRSEVAAVSGSPAENARPEKPRKEKAVKEPAPKKEPPAKAPRPEKAAASKDRSRKSGAEESAQAGGEAAADDGIALAPLSAYASAKREPPPPSYSGGSTTDGAEKARDVMTRLYALVERGDIMEAHKRFQQTKEPLKKYLDTDTYNMLEFTIIQSYNYVLRK